MTSPPPFSSPETRRPPGRPKPVTAEWLFRAAIHYLGRYASSTENLRRVLARKIERRLKTLHEDGGLHEQAGDERFDAMIEAALARLTELQLLDDEAYAGSRFAALRARGTSLRHAQAKLQQKGLARAAVEAALAADRLGDGAAAHAFARRRRLGPHRRAERLERRERDIAAMMRAGFSFGDAKAAIDAAPTEEDEG